jgi:hypothetical protein
MAFGDEMVNIFVTRKAVRKTACFKEQKETRTNAPPDVQKTKAAARTSKRLTNGDRRKKRYKEREDETVSGDK